MVLRDGYRKFLLILPTVLLLASHAPGQQASKVEKRISKNIEQAWPDREMKRSELDLSLYLPDYQDRKPEDKIFLLEDNSGRAGYLVLSSARGRYESFDFMILYDTLGMIKNVDVLVYRSDHGHEIMNKGWLRQFAGTKGCDLSYGKDIDALSGATISANALTKEIQRWCKVLESASVND